MYKDVKYSSMIMGLIIFIPAHIFGQQFGTSDPCEVNINCSQGNDWCDQRRSVVLIEMPDNFGGVTYCTGALVTNERRDLKPYIITARHCIDANKDEILSNEEKDNIANWRFFFNYQAMDCSNPPTAPASPYRIIGATFVEDYKQTDFVLLLLSQRPPGNYNTFYAGWSNDNENPKSGVLIHHPEGDIKKISTYTKNPDRVHTNGRFVWKVNFDTGDAEGGSSGAPLFNQDKRFVGQHSFNNNKPICANNSRLFSGRFSRTWEKSASVRAVLSPNSTSSFFIQSMSGDEPCKPNYFFQNTNDLHTSANINGLSNPSSAGTRSYNGVYMASGTIETGQNVTIQSGTSVQFYGETIILGPGFTAEAGSHFVAEPKPCLRGCNTGVGRMSNDFEEDEEFITLSSGQPTQEDDEENEELLTPLIISGNMLLFPNPTSGKFTLLTSLDVSEKYSVKIYDYTGKLIISEINLSNATLDIDLSEHSKGIYLVQVQSGENVYTNKIIIQ